MNKRYPIPDSEFCCEYRIERSRFIVQVAHTPSVEAAQSFIQSVRERFGDANHNCWAYLVGSPGSTDRVALSDDGEPHGTAGKPMLTALLHGGVGDIAVVITRYFGGVKLGTGGLVRAYTAGVQQALEQMPRSEKVEWAPLVLEMDYADLAPIERLLGEYEATSVQTDYGARVRMRLHVPRERRCALEAQLLDRTAGRVLVLGADEI